MIIGTLKETNDKECRVAISPESCKRLTDLGLTVLIENNAGVNSSFSNTSYEKAGGELIADKINVINKVDILLSVTSIPDEKTLESSNKNLILVGTFNPYENFENLNRCAKRNMNVISLDLLPRISRAQSMDVLSSQANLAGYKAVVLASNLFKKAFPMMMTAAGTIIPAKCLILGAGVAGLQAIATAKRLGCVVTAFDVRPEVEEQVKSLGAKFIKVEDENSTIQENSVYAKEMTEEYKLKQKTIIHEKARDMDIIITTAMIPGKKAPLLIESQTLKEMKLGSIIVDLAGSSGGNVEKSEYGKEVTVNGIIICSPTNLPSLVSFDASSLYAKNVFNFITSFLSEEKVFDINSNDELLSKSIIIKNGSKTQNFLEES